MSAVRGGSSSFPERSDGADETMGLWIMSAEAARLTVSGSVESLAEIALYRGWNLGGYPLSTTRAITVALSSTAILLLRNLLEH